MPFAVGVDREQVMPHHTHPHTNVAAISRLLAGMLRKLSVDQVGLPILIYIETAHTYLHPPTPMLRANKV